QPAQRMDAVPDRHLRARRRQPPLDGERSAGPAGQPRARLQRVEQQHLPVDPPGELRGGEVSLVEGTGAQQGSFKRWGDYSTMSVDPVDGCTFWYTQEYYANSGSFDFKTRIGSFRLPGC